MDRRRSVMMAGGVVVAALAIGQVMQSGSAESSVTMYPTGTSQPQPQSEPKPEPLRLAAGTPLAADHDAPAPVPVRLDVEGATTAPKDPLPAIVKADVCAPMLDAFADDAANLSITLTAPCHPNQTVVLQHAGLAVTFQTTATGALFASIPGLQPDGALSIRFPERPYPNWQGSVGSPCNGWMPTPSPCAPTARRSASAQCPAPCRCWQRLSP